MEIPRRNFLDKLTPAELAVHEAILKVEGIGSSPVLTSVVIDLLNAKQRLSDFVDGKSQEPLVNPRYAEIIRDTATYKVPVYCITDNGLSNAGMQEIKFCKGSKNDQEVFRQEGYLSETLIHLVKIYLESVNKGDLSSRETSMAITKLDEALLWLKKRSDDREYRGVQGTYNK